MTKPSWFNIISEWRSKGMGEYGVTLPFLVGALAYEKGHDKASLNDTLTLLTNMIENPVDGYMVVIRWCLDIEEPVISMKDLNDPFNIVIKDGYHRPNNGGFSMAFTEDLMSMFNLNCKDAEECKNKLADRTKSYVENGLFSKNFNPETQNREFGHFSERDIAYIESVVSNLV